MSFNPTKFYLPKIGLVFVLILVFLFSCSRDTDLLLDSVLDGSEETEEVVSIDPKTETETPDAEEEEEEETVAEEVALESRVTAFPSIQDAHTQSGKGFNQDIVRLEEGNRKSYLMFDLRPIAEIKGTITAVELEFTIVSDSGNGDVKVYKGDSTEWDEINLSEETVPETESLLGSITKEYEIGATEKIELDVQYFEEELKTLVLSHENGDDLSFASKEHPSVEGPKLIVTYDSPTDAAEIVIEQEQNTTDELENKAPIAIADATPKSGQVPLTVNFKGNNSTDDKSIASYSWKIKEGIVRTNPNPSYTFDEVGTYEVELTVTDEEGLTDIDTVEITVTAEANEAPKAVASATPKSGEAPLEVNFDGSNSTDDNGVVSYNWDFKDGNTASNAKPKHTFTEAGTYKVKLTVEDENGLTGTNEITINVTEAQNKKPVANISANKTSGTAPLVVNFKGDNSTDDDEVTSYSWDFDNGASSTQPNPSHTFNSPGTYQVELEVKDKQGLSDKKSITITVTASQNNAPKAISTPSVTSGAAPLTVNFTGNKSTDDKGIVSYSWDFKDGSTSSDPNPTHIFENPGTYRVELTVTDEEGATDTDTDTITVTASNNNNNNGGNTNGGSNGNYPPNAVLASSFGFKAGDATEAFEDALKSNHSFIVIDKQSSDWIIRPTRLFNVDNKTIVFEEGVVLRAKSGAFSAHNAVLFNLFESDNVTIRGYGATLRMNKSEYGRSEFRHALLLDGCKNITIQGLTIRDSGGDGINLNTSPSRRFSENITIEDVTSINNSRMGLTVISAKDVWVRNSTFSQSKGQAPEAGIGLEPNNNLERLQNVNFINCKLTRNNGPGFYIGVINLTKNSTPLSIKVTDTEFNFNSQNNNYQRPHAELRLSDNPSGTNNVMGTATFERLNFNGSRSRIIWSQKADEAYKVVFRNCTANNVSNSEANPIQLEGKAVANNLGGFDFGNFYIEYTKNKSFMKLTVPQGTILKNIKGNFRIKEPGNNPIDYNTRANPANGVNVNLNYTHID